MANHLINGSTTAFRESLIPQGCRNSSVIAGILIYQLVNLSRTHSCMDFLFHQVEHTCIDDAATTNSFNLLRSLNQLASRNQMPFILIKQHFLVQFRQFCPFGYPPVYLMSLHNRLFYLCAKV